MTIIRRPSRFGDVTTFRQAMDRFFDEELRPFGFATVSGPALPLDVTHDADVAKVSIIGIGMRAHPGVAQTMFRTLSDKGINIQVISTSEIKVSVLIDEEYVELAVRALHSAYELDAV